MSFRMLACDYDRTLAEDGVVHPDTIEALSQLKEAGWLPGLVTGRELADLLAVCKRIDIFELVVAENGAVLYFPNVKQVIELAGRPAPEFIAELSRRKVPFSAGNIIIATDQSYAYDLLSAIRELGLELEIIFNRDSAMVLPTGVNKATGLQAGAGRIGLNMSEVIAVGDAENDHAFLQACGLSVAVANALDSIKADADIVTKSPSGLGVIELINEYLLNPSWTPPEVRRNSVVTD